MVKFKIILLIFFWNLNLSLYSQNNQGLFEELTKILINESPIKNQLEIESNGEKKYYVYKVDSLYKVDESRKIRLSDSCILFILPEDELFFYMINKWLSFDLLEITDNKVFAKVNLIEIRDGYKRSVFKAQYIFKKGKSGLYLKRKKYLYEE